MIYYHGSMFPCVKGIFKKGLNRTEIKKIPKDCRGQDSSYAVNNVNESHHSFSHKTELTVSAATDYYAQSSGIL